MTSTGRHAADPVWRLSLTGGVVATVAVTGIFTSPTDVALRRWQIATRQPG